MIIHTLESAPEGSKAKLNELQQGMGTITNMFGVLANSPAILNGYTALMNQLFQNGLLTPAEQMLVLLTTSSEHECRYCVPIYSLNGPKRGLDPEVVKAVRNHQAIQDTKLAALHNVTLKLIRTRGKISEDDTKDFFAVGYTEGHLLEVLGGIALKTITNYLTRFSNVPLDDFLEDFAWEPAA